MGEARRAAGEFIWYHGNMNQYMSILDVKQERRLDLERIRVILDQKVTSCLFSLRRQLLEQSHQLGQIQVIDGKMLMPWVT
jgi:hypothetical protein